MLPQSGTRLNVPGAETELFASSTFPLKCVVPVDRNDDSGLERISTNRIYAKFISYNNTNNVRGKKVMAEVEYSQSARGFISRPSHGPARCRTSMKRGFLLSNAFGIFTEFIKHVFSIRVAVGKAVFRIKRLQTKMDEESGSFLDGR